MRADRHSWLERRAALSAAASAEVKPSGAQRRKNGVTGAEGRHRCAIAHGCRPLLHPVPLMTTSVTELGGSADLLSDRYLSPRR